MDNTTKIYRDKEIAREDAKDKFLTIVDNTDFTGVYQYQFNTTPEERKEKNLSQPYNKVAMKLICYAEGKKAMFMQYCDVDDFLLFADNVIKFRGPLQADQKILVHEFVGFSERKGEYRKLSVFVVPKMKDPSKCVFMFNFEKGAATPSGEKGYKVTDPSKVEKNFIALDTDQLKKMVLISKEHLQALRTAVITLHYKALYSKD